MVVEDSSSFREIVKYNLRDQFPSMVIIEAADGVEAVQKIDSAPPNLIFMDIGLPGENGLESTRKIKADHPDVIILSLRVITRRDIERRPSDTRLIISFPRVHY